MGTHNGGLCAQVTIGILGRSCLLMMERVTWGGYNRSTPVLRILWREYSRRSSETNRKNKGKQKWFHCAGTRCVADISEERRVKGSPDLDRSDLFIKRHTRKDGKPTNEAAKHVIEKLKSLKSAQPLSDDSTPHQVAARNDTYTQVLGPDRLGRVSGVGTGPTPTSMWGNESKEALRTENRLLMQRMTELETSMAEKFAKMESMIRGSQATNDGKCTPSAHVDVHMTSAVEGQAVDEEVKCITDCGDISKLIGKRVRLVDIDMQHVADGILISTEIEKEVMGRKMGTEYCYGPSMMLLSFDFMLTICMNIARGTFYFEIH
ncbi:hypothetical protein Taro_037351 [Colocasia esculenta]|uniref:Transposase n=1 Tax=Colocasia esculenta TaxID=4460 RepID=A0A843W9H9_COLES|nr:hypothetical protein [Colocasia esculenta]